MKNTAKHGSRTFVSLLCASALLALAGCGTPQAPAQSSAAGSAPDQSTSADGSTGQKMEQLTVYYGDKNAECILSKTVDVPEITSMSILAALQDVNVVQKDVTMENSLVNEDSVILDCSAALQTQLQNLGSAGEYILVGSIVNTYLTAYDVKEITLTANGKPLEGHMDYSEPLTFFEAAPATTITGEATIEGETTSIEMTKIYSLLGCAIGYDSEQFRYDPASSVAPVTFARKDTKDTVTRFTIRTSTSSVKDQMAALTKEETATLKDQDDKASVGTESIPATLLTFQDDAKTDAGSQRVARYYLFEGNGLTWIIQLQTTAETQETLMPRMEAMLNSFYLVS